VRFITRISAAFCTATKPGNILLDGEENTPYVTDFGLAKWLGRDYRLTIAATALGTPNYMAPEQASGASASLTTAADVYSLGAILYELLAGRPPFVADTPLETLKLARKRSSRVRRRRPRDLDVICRKALAKEPGARYSSAAALAGGSRTLAGGPHDHRAPRVDAERFWRWAKRNPAGRRSRVTTLALFIAVSIGSDDRGGAFACAE
jgi:serine/threonine protein kinase